MVRKKGKSISFDAMVKFFMHTYDIPTKRDVDKLLARLDRLEGLLSAASTSGRSRSVRRGRGAAADVVLDVIKRSKQGLKFVDIQSKTGFAEKKGAQHYFSFEQTAENQAAQPRRLRRRLKPSGRRQLP